MAAVRYLEEAIALDPSYAQAYAGLADTHIILGDHGYRPGRESLDQARVAVDRALSLDPESAEAWTSNAWIQWVLDWDWSGAESSFRRAIQLNPNYATAHQWYAAFLHAAGRLPEAVESSRRSVRLDPLSCIIQVNAAEIYLKAGDVSQAMRLTEKTLELDPDFLPAQKLMIGLELLSDRQEKARRRWESLRRGDINPLVVLYFPEFWPIDPEKRTISDATLEELLAVLRNAEEKWDVSALSYAFIYHKADRPAEAMEWLERASQPGDRLLLQVPSQGNWDRYRGNPRFERFLERISWPAR